MRRFNAMFAASVSRRWYEHRRTIYSTVDMFTRLHRCPRTKTQESFAPLCRSTLHKLESSGSPSSFSLIKHLYALNDSAPFKMISMDSFRWSVRSVFQFSTPKNKFTAHFLSSAHRRQKTEDRMKQTTTLECRKWRLILENSIDSFVRGQSVNNEETPQRWQEGSLSHCFTTFL